MSAEEIIHAWKQEPQSGKKQSNIPDAAEEPEKEPDKDLTNPAGGQELSDEELKLIEGGLMVGTQSACSCVTCDPNC
ncbi:MAG TPA: hypothetical protein VKR06_37530 [Ktedonosporobacter sp.]|nr:hypothetical protein [Ktedonosporobacter sp.]